MLFHEAIFVLVFLPVVLAGFYLLGSRSVVAGKLWLVLASLFFYGWWNPANLPLILISTGVNFAIADQLRRNAERVTSAKFWLGLGIALNLVALGYYKYAGFADGVLHQLFGWSPGWTSHELPLAISFFTFTQIAYLVDVYRDRSLHYPALDYGFFVFFFPHLIAGPIVRHWEILPQFQKERFRFEARDFDLGWLIFMAGMTKKVILADPLSVVSREVFGAYASGLYVSTWETWIGVLAYTGQLYFDFSGYSDMAIGLARMFGIRFPQNFASPYQATSIIEFWQRWHITLTRFFREYVYFPLGGNRKGAARQYVNLMVTMGLSGLWHGASWTFVVWGLWHGVWLAVNHLWRQARGVARNPAGSRWGAVGTFFVVMLGWVIFRADSFSTAVRITRQLFFLDGFTFPVVWQKFAWLGQVPGVRWQGDRFVSDNFGWDLVHVLAVLGVAWFVPNLQTLLARLEPVFEKIPAGRWQLRPAWWMGAALGLVYFIVFRGYFTVRPSEFIYFNF